MKFTKILAGLALVCSMGSAMALTSTVTGTTGTTSYTFEDGITTNPIATLTLAQTGPGLKFLSLSFDESTSYTATSLVVNYTNGGNASSAQSFTWTTNDFTFSGQQIGAANAKFTSAVLTYAAAVTPVPEPETYAMLLAGLGLMGAIARRRKNKQA
jgi:hypothetical protein